MLPLRIQKLWVRPNLFPALMLIFFARAFLFVALLVLHINGCGEDHVNDLVDLGILERAGAIDGSAESWPDRQTFL